MKSKNRCDGQGSSSDGGEFMWENISGNGHMEEREGTGRMDLREFGCEDGMGWDGLLSCTTGRFVNSGVEPSEFTARVG